MISHAPTKEASVSPSYDVEFVVDEKEQYEVFSPSLTEDEVKGWIFPSSLTKSLPLTESLVLKEIARLEQRLTKALYLFWDSTLDPQDKKEIREAASRILKESSGIEEMARMLCELGK